MKYGKHRIPWLKESTVLKDILKDTTIILGWIIGLVVVASLCWFFTQPARNRFLINAVNHVLEQSGDYRRVSEPISRGSSRAHGLGRWYYFSGETRVYIFTFIVEGAFFPCAAVKTAEGRIEEFIPLSRHGERMFARISAEMLNIYAQRIEKGNS